MSTERELYRSIVINLFLCTTGSRQHCRSGGTGRSEANLKAFRPTHHNLPDHRLRGLWTVDESNAVCAVPAYMYDSYVRFGTHTEYRNVQCDANVLLRDDARRSRRSVIWWWNFWRCFRQLLIQAGGWGLAVH